MTARPVPSGLLVVDASSHQPPLDWPAIAAAGVVGAYVRVAEGVTPDARFEAHRKGAEDAGLLVGAYQYARARHHGLDLAEVFRRIADDGLTLPPVFDVEDLDGRPSTEVRQCIARWLDSWLGIAQPAIYTGPAFWDTHIAVEQSTALTEGVPLWLANYSGRTDWPKPARGWEDVTLWQFTDSWEYAPGAPHLDCSVFRGTREELAALAIDSSTEAKDTNPC